MPQPIKTEAQTEDLFLGAMTGTSMDGMDLVAVQFDRDEQAHLVHQRFIEYPLALKAELQQLALDPNATIDQFGALDTRLGQFYAEQVKTFIQDNQMREISALGSHGQTVRHNINPDAAYTLQIGDPNIIAARCGIPVVADFRRRDLALGGEGAPLAPAFHQNQFRSSEINRVIINVGGIANVTHLPADPELPVTGFDTGPGNTLMDYICQSKLNRPYDKEGSLARRGIANLDWVGRVLQEEPYFKRPHPKSTGTDYFSPQWLEQSGLLLAKPEDALSSLLELTALSISNEINSMADVEECYVCGGGAHNQYLLERLEAHLGPCQVHTTEKLGLHPDWIEACAFAWLAMRTMNKRPGNLPSVTNAEKFTILGAVYF